MQFWPIKYASGQDAVFLGRDYTQTNNSHSGQVAFEIDQQVRKIIDSCYEEARRIIEENKDKLIVIANALLEYETLANEEIECLYETGAMPVVSGKTDKISNDETDIKTNDVEVEENETVEEPVQEEKTEPKVVSYDDLDDLIDEMKNKD